MEADALVVMRQVSIVHSLPASVGNAVGIGVVDRNPLLHLHLREVVAVAANLARIVAIAVMMAQVGAMIRHQIVTCVQELSIQAHLAPIVRGYPHHHHPHLHHHPRLHLLRHLHRRRQHPHLRVRW